LRKTKGNFFFQTEKTIFLLMLFIYKYLYPKKIFAPYDVKKMRLKKFFFQHIRFDIRPLPQKISLKNNEVFFGIFYQVK